jgi:hypothetical protein
MRGGGDVHCRSEWGMAPTWGGSRSTVQQRTTVNSTKAQAAPQAKFNRSGDMMHAYGGLASDFGSVASSSFSDGIV